MAVSLQAIGDSQELWTWGCGKHGRLGHGGQANESLPRRVEHFVVPRARSLLGSGLSCKLHRSALGSAA